MLRIAARDLARLGRMEEITREISDVADVCLDTVWQICQRQSVERFGQPWHQDAEGRWRPTRLACWAWANSGTGAELQLRCGRAVCLQRGRAGLQGTSR